MPPVVFISFSAKDQKLASAIHAFLNASGIKTLKAPEDIAPGTNWAAAITEMIESCTHMVLVWTSNSMASQEVSKELTLAMQCGAVIIPFRSEDLEPEGAWRYHLSQVQWLEAHCMPEGQALEALLRQVGGCLPLVSLTTPAGAPAAARPPSLPSSAMRALAAHTQDYGHDENKTIRTKKLTASLLAFMLGLVGAHKFLLGLAIPGCIYLGGWVLVFVIVGVFGSEPDAPPNNADGVGGLLMIFMFGMALAESITYFFRSVEDFDRINVKGKRPWF